MQTLQARHYTEPGRGKSRGNFDFYATDDSGQLWQVVYTRKSATKPGGVKVHRAQRDGEFICIFLTLGGGDVCPAADANLIAFARDQLRAKENS